MVTPWCTMVHHGIPQYDCDVLWYTVVPWYTMDYHGLPRCTMVHHPWYAIVYHGIPWCTMTWPYGDTSRLCYGVPWYTMVHHTIPWCTTSTVPLCSRLYHGLPWFTIVYHGLPCLHHGIAWHTMFVGIVRENVRNTAKKTWILKKNVKNVKKT